MEEATPKNWDLIVKVIGLIAILVSGGWTLYKFREDRRIDLEHRQEERRVDLEHQRIADAKDDEARLQEFNKYVFEGQTDLYFEAARTAATIASSKDKAVVKRATDRFRQLFYGELVIVEDRRIELAMIAFGRCLDIGGTNCERIVRTDQSGNKIPTEKLLLLGPPVPENLALELAACVRFALERDRGVRFGELTDPKTDCPYN